MIKIWSAKESQVMAEQIYESCLKRKQSLNYYGKQAKTKKKKEKNLIRLIFLKRNSGQMHEYENIVLSKTEEKVCLKNQSQHRIIKR